MSKIMLGRKAEVKIPNSYLYGDHKGFERIGEITKINKKTYEVTVRFEDGFSCVRVKKEEIKLV